MIVLDTNVISEIMKLAPSSQVIAWLDSQEASKLFVTTITIAEIAYGIHVLPEGKRRAQLEDSFTRAFKEAFAHRVLAFDEPSAYQYGVLMSKRKLLGQPISVPDGQIAAITKMHHFTLATRNTRDFQHCDLELINPFE